MANREPTNEKTDQLTGEKKNAFGIQRHIFFGLTVMTILIGGAGGWAATAQLSSAIIAPGSLVVDRHVKKVQHREGGIVAKINVKNGDRVEAGEILLELDMTQINAEIGIIRGQLIELTARSARLEAERDGFDKISFAKAMYDMGAEARAVTVGEKRLFYANKVNQRSQVAQLKSQVDQLNQEILGIEAQRNSKRAQFKLIDLELQGVRKLYKQGLTPVARVYSMEREVMRLKGEYGGLIAQVARAKGKISEVNLQILSVGQTATTQAQRELRTLEARIVELKERRIAAIDKQDRSLIKAPQSGIVHELSVHTIGGVITTAEPILLIVPNNERLIIEARFLPADIDQIVVGRKARLRFSAFDQKTTPEVDGQVLSVAADVTSDPKTGQNYYLGRIEISEDVRAELKDLKLLPGMPVEAFISTGNRTALSYLVKPLTDQFERALREN
ncbi:MAG: HlyD family secretion protein [Hyphomicrobiaceae bacterium]|jgi:HlyD family secretion protein